MSFCQHAMPSRDFLQVRRRIPPRLVPRPRDILESRWHEIRRRIPRGTHLGPRYGSTICRLGFRHRRIRRNLANNLTILHRSPFSGLVTYGDGTNGFPRHEGFFQDCRFIRKYPCGHVIERARKSALLARSPQHAEPVSS